MTLKEYFQNSYQGSDSFLENIIYPIFGENNFDSHYESEVLDSVEELQPLAEAIGITSIKDLGTLHLNYGNDPVLVFDITVNSHVQMRRNRVNTQMLVRRLIDTYSSAFMLFHYENDTNGDWRFSFCRKGRSNDDTTSSKRFTFLLGPGQACRTVADNFQKLADMLQVIRTADIIEAFSVENLSDEFFYKYLGYYASFVKYFTGKPTSKEEGDKAITRSEFRQVIREMDDLQLIDTDNQYNRYFRPLFETDDDAEKCVRNYIKKMMGRIVFLHFLQKKGWMGVPVNRNDWKGGDMDFMWNLFCQASNEQQEDYLDSVLEPLFFNCLNNGERGDVYDTMVEQIGRVKVPYLNGGLFERETIDEQPSKFPSEYFRRFLQFLREYNFTIDENDPNDAEIGVDPEMLGKIFENLLEDNKDKGAFYTPKEIVQYMCRESINAYLQAHKDDGIAELELLKRVKVCDPAIGSGAFPMGILNELCIRRAALGEEITADTKREIVQQNIYGVDIEQGAVDIARLRFWLAIVVDAEQPEPLPNLDYKIMLGNSLLEQYKGVDLSKLATQKTEIIGNTQLSFFDDITDVQRKNIQDLLTSYYSQHENKAQLREEIRQNVIKQLQECGINESVISELSQTNLAATPKFFLWHTWFADVFNRNGGFDVVIGNPPYVNANDLKKNIGERQYKDLKSLFITAKGAVDLYVYFFEKGFDLLTPNGVLSYITPNKYLSANYGKELRRFIINNSQIYCLKDMSRDCIFDASVYPIITFLLKSRANDYCFSSVDKNNKTNKFNSGQLTIFPDNIWGFLLSDKYNLSLKIVQKSHGILDCCKINATSTASEADEFHEYINQQNDGFRLINTGTIDPFVTKWGLQKLVDKGEKYLCPRIPKDEALLGTYRYNMYCSKKIVVAKMASRLEAFLDEDGEYASINTNCIHNLTIDGKLLLAWLHSKVFHYVYECYFESLKMSGGYLPFSAPYLSCMCIPDNIESITTPIISIINRILSAKRTNPQVDITSEEREIDLLVYRLYGLTYDEVKVIDPETTITEVEYNEV